MSDNRKELIDEMKRLVWGGPGKAVESWEEHDAIINRAIAALSHQEPDAAQGCFHIESMPGCKCCAQVDAIYQNGKEAFALRWLRDEIVALGDGADGDTARTLMDMLKRRATSASDAAQGSEHGGDAPSDELVSGWMEKAKGRYQNELHHYRFVAMNYAQWLDKNRATQPVQKPYAYEVVWPSGHRFALFQPDPKVIQDRIDLGCCVTPLYTSPQPVQGGDEAVDEED